MSIGSYSPDKTKRESGRFYGGHVDVNLVTTWFESATGICIAYGDASGLYSASSSGSVPGVKNRMDIEIGNGNETAPAWISAFLCIKY
jgi:hypothetical protein